MLPVSTLGHLALDDQAGQTFDERGLADAGLADVERVVLAAAAQDLDRPLDLELAADQRVDAPLVRQPIEVRRVFLERRAAFAFALALGRRRVLAARIALLAGAFARPCEM